MTQIEDGLIQAGDYPVRLPIFEGPLDLLLFLIRKNEIDIYDIPIETVTRQYLEVLYGMEQLSLEVAGEFFVMAATLMQIKSRLLLPRDEQPAEEEAEGGEDPRWELVQQLIEYRRFKEAAEELARLSDFAADSIPREVRPEDAETPQRPLRPVDRLDLWNTFNQVLRRLSDRIVVGEIHEEVVTVSDRMEFILGWLQTRNEFRFSALFARGEHSLNFVIASFLAVLELTRLSRLRLRQDESFSDILCTACENDETLQPEEDAE